MALTESESAGEAINYDTLDLAELFEVLEKPVMAYAVRLVRDHGTAQDLVQEAFMRLHPVFNEIEKPRPWIYRTVYNLAMNTHRKQKRMIKLDDQERDQLKRFEEFGEAPLDPDSYMQYQEVIDFLMLQVKNLEERTRKVVELKFEKDFSYRQISEQLGISVSNVGYILHHAIKDLAGILRKEGFIE